MPIRAALVLLFATIGLTLSPVAQAEPLVLQLTVASDINPATASYISRGIDAAHRRGAAMVLIKLDTPGGQMISMRQITSDILHSTIPVGVWVAPEGARAASAGTFIVYAAHIAGMAPSTTIGAAHPVMMTGGMPGAEPSEGMAKQLDTLTEKIVNDAVSQIRGLAAKRGRNAEWAERAVRESITATATEAVKQGVVDFIAATADQFAEQAAGRTVETPAGEVTLETSGARIESLEMSWRESLLSVLAHPNVAYLLLIIGFYGIIFELKMPGIGGAGVVGMICLILALYGLSVLPFNFAGLALIIAGIGMLVAELYTPTYGVLGVGGLAAFVIGSLILMESPATPVSRPLILGVAVATGGFFLLALGAIVKGQRRPIAIGRGALVGATGRVRQRLAPEGLVHVEGSVWSATCEGEPIEAGEEIVVVEELPHMRLKVKRKE